MDRRYLTMIDLYGGGPVGIETRGRLSEPRDTLEEVVEPTHSAWPHRPDGKRARLNGRGWQHLA